MDISMESFHVGGTKRGALLRRQTPTELRSLTVFRTADGLYRADQVLTHPGDVRDWTAFVHTTPEGSTAARRPSPTSLEVDGTRREVPADTLPSWAGPVALAAMLAGCGTELELHELSEGDPTADPTPAHFSVGNPEPVTLPGRGTQQLGSVTLFRGDQPANRFWFDSHEVVASDWQGAQSYHEEDLDRLLAGLDDEIVSAVREFIA